jgi:hypothetical protein
MPLLQERTLSQHICLAALFQGTPERTNFAGRHIPLVPLALFVCLQLSPRRGQQVLGSGFLVWLLL